MVFAYVVATFHSISCTFLFTTMDKLVSNLSECRLSKDQISILSKGLNVCLITGEPRPGEPRCDLDSLYRRLRLHSFFKDDEVPLPPEGSNLHCLDEFKHSKFWLASKFNPPGPPALESMIVLKENDFNNSDVFTATDHNITVGEHNAIK